jgi:hypothetical protein
MGKGEPGESVCSASAQRRLPIPGGRHQIADREPQTAHQEISTGPVTAVGFASINAEIRTELEETRTLCHVLPGAGTDTSALHYRNIAKR